jgi:hypothetical protein
MSQSTPGRKVLFGALGAGLILAAKGVAGETEEFDEHRVLIEINATDGDAGFHALIDGDAWKEVTLNGSKLFAGEAKGALREQGMSEIFFESDEPPCSAEVADEDEEFVTVAEVLERFPTGPYQFSGKSIEPGDMLASTATLTHDLPAAPDITAFDGTEGLDPDDVVITWAAGDDLGECDVPEGITDPAAVEVLYWEVVVEPEEEDQDSPIRVFSVQVPPDITEVHVSPQYLTSYQAEGVTEFKFEIGAVENRMIDGEPTKGNQTFSEGTFTIAEAD